MFSLFSPRFLDEMMPMFENIFGQSLCALGAPKNP